MPVSTVNFGPMNIQKNWFLIDEDPKGFDHGNNYAIAKKEHIAAKRSYVIGRRVEVIKGRFLDAGKTAAAAAFGCRLGGQLLEHGIAVYLYRKLAPSNAFQQYFYAHAVHAFSTSIMNYTVCGVTVSSLATFVVALLVGVIVTKTGVTVYNLSVRRECRVKLSLVATVRDIFWRK